MVEDPQLPNRLPYPAGLWRFAWGCALAGGTAVLAAVATGLVTSGTYFVLGVVVFALCAHWFFARAGSRRTRAKLTAWAAERYDLQLPPAATLALTRATRNAGAVVGDWTSEPANVLHQNEAGSWAYIEVRLAKREGGWFLYSPDYGDEVPQVVAEGPEQDLSASLSPLMGEVLEAGGLHCIVIKEEDGSEGGLRMVDSTSGREIELLWSDALRAELFLGQLGPVNRESARIELRAGDTLVQELLPYMSGENVWVGLNWGTEGATAFEAEVVRTFLGRYI